MNDVSALYLILLAAVCGYLLIARVPAILHTPMMSGSNFIHGIVLIGAMLALGNASGPVEQVIGFVAVTTAAANVVGGFVVTDRMLALFDTKGANASMQSDGQASENSTNAGSGNSATGVSGAGVDSGRNR